MDRIDRRSFLDSSAKGAIGLSAVAATVGATRRAPAGANERVRIALIGLGGRGSSLVRNFARRSDVEITVLCDLDQKRSLNLGKQIQQIQGKAPRRVNHYNKVFDDKNVDAVIVATPDHWHAPLTIFACRAGKDVYVEKPPTHNVWEGRKMVEAARRYKRIVQVGTQNRSAPFVHKALEYIRSGALGTIHLCKVYNMLSTGSFRLGPDSDPPEGLDWNTWLGPAPERPFNARILRGGWHRLWAYSGGLMADDGIHQLDIARWLIGKDYPKRVHCSGGNFAFQDDREVPDTQVVTYDYDEMIMTFEQTWFTPYMQKTPGSIRSGDEIPPWPQNSTRIELYGTKRQMYVGRHGGGWQVFAGDGKLVAQEFGRPGDDPHRDNFIECIRSRKQPNGNPEDGHRSACLVHLANISYRLGGRDLQFDAKTETLVGDDEANKMLKRTYREPFVVPEEV